MEYPMITFNGYRPSVEKKDDSEDEDEAGAEDNAIAGLESSAETASKQTQDTITYSRQIKYGLIGVIIH